MPGKDGYEDLTSDQQEDSPAQSCADSIKTNRCDALKENFLLIAILAGVISGVIVGVIVTEADPEFHLDKRKVMYLGFLGELFLRMLMCMIIPIITTTLISGMASLDYNTSGRVIGYALLFYITSMFLAVLLGIVLVTIIKPGVGVEKPAGDKNFTQNPADSILDLLRNALTNNIVAACFTQTKTTYTTRTVVTGTENVTMGNITSEENVTAKEITDFSVGSADGTNVLGLVVFSIVLGVVIGKMGEQGLPVKNFVDSLQEAIIRIVKIIIWYSPIGICFILAARIAGMEDPLAEFEKLGWYMMTVILGLIIHAFIVLPLIYVIFARKNPFKLMYHMAQALLTALGTASSSATLPVTMQCLEENAKVDRRVSRFVLPVGATINMDGTALYEAVASIFIAQLNNISLNAGQIVTVSITATAAAIGAAGVPEAGLVTMLIVLTAVGLPTEDVALIFAVDWLLDRFRTSVNVWGDSVGAGIVETLSKDKLNEIDNVDDIDEGFEKKPRNGNINPGFEYDGHIQGSRL